MVRRVQHRGSLTLLPSLLAAGGLALGCSSSGQFEIIETRLAEVQRQLAEIHTTIPSRDDVAQLDGRLSEQSDRSLRSDADLELELTSLTERIGELEESIRDSLYRLDQLSQQVAMTNQELRALITAPPFPRGEGSAPPPPAADPETLYELAYSQYQKGDYERALVGFEGYLDSSPESPLADNALYWIGECHFSLQHFTLAIEAFNDVALRYPGSEKIASAQLKSGFAHVQLGDVDQARDQLRELLRQHPSSAEAELARREIDRLESSAPNAEPSASR